MPPDSPLDILALFQDLRPLRGLIGSLRQNGCAVDLCRDLATARAAFLAAGGHQLLLIGPDVAQHLAESVTRELRQIDPALAAVTFGPRCAGADRPSRSAALTGLHPSSRAGHGALLRWIRGLSESPPNPGG